MDKKLIKSAFEAMMFTWGEPLSVKVASQVMDINEKDAYECFRELQKEYELEGRGIRIREVNMHFQFITHGECCDYIKKLCTPIKKKRLSQSALEVLAIIAYKQPVTRGEIEAIRGIKCERVIESLEKKELIESVGRSNSLGRPMLYGTTDIFLRKFGFESIKELPAINDIEEIFKSDDELLKKQQISFGIDNNELEKDSEIVE